MAGSGKVFLTNWKKRGKTKKIGEMGFFQEMPRGPRHQSQLWILICKIKKKSIKEDHKERKKLVP